MSRFLISLSLALFISFPALATETYPPVVVIELFSSEGCSSCPPADILLSKLVTVAREQNLHLYPLSFHVDYWNYLGWRDPYAQKDFTLRQQWYAKQLEDKVYTPQVVINGRYSLLGSDDKKIQKLINKSFKELSSVKVDLTLLKMDQKRLLGSFHLEGNWQGKNLSVAIVERGLSTDVGRGENAGRRLNHENVVRQFQRLAPQEQTGSFVFAPVSADHLDRFSVIAFVQDPEFPEVLGATAINLSDVQQ